MKTICHYQTQIGKIAIAAQDGFVTNLDFGESAAPAHWEARETPVQKEAFRQLESYLRGERDSFSVPLAPSGTPFQERVWQALLAIPYGKTASYKEIAAAAGSPKACRAVGMANNRNPISIFIPCHRVIGADGQLAGYGGGLEIKAKLLQLEKDNTFFEYGQTEIDHLKKRDKKLGQAIDKIGLIRRKVNPDIFSALVSSVISQQISGRAAETIWQRLFSLLGEVTPPKVAAAELEAIQKCGMSTKKASYIKGIARAVLDGELDFAAFAALTDAEIIKKLSTLNGIGVWTAEMLLIFSLRRPDVLSWGDLGIKRGMMNLYKLKEIDKDTFEKLRKKYSPYGTAASLYLWALSKEN